MSIAADEHVKIQRELTEQTRLRYTVEGEAKELRDKLLVAAVDKDRITFLDGKCKQLD